MTNKSPNLESYKLLFPDEFQIKFLKNNTREDGRLFREFRKRYIVPECEKGMSRVFMKIGNGNVYCKVRNVIGSKSKDLAKKGMYFDVKVTYWHHWDEEITKVDQDKETKYLTAELQRVLGNVFDYEFLYIGEKDNKEYFWTCQIELIILECDGVLIDPCVLSCLAGLSKLMIPTTVSLTDFIIPSNSSWKRFHFSQLPIPLSFTIVNDKYILADPNLSEIRLSQSNIVTIYIDALKSTLYSIEKSAGTRISDEWFKKCITIASEHSTELQSLFQHSMKQ